MESKLPSRSVLIAFVLTVLFAGNNAIAVRFSNAELPPFFGAAIRLAIASQILFIMVLFGSVATFGLSVYVTQNGTASTSSYQLED